MKTFKRFAALSAPERTLVLLALALVPAVRIALWTFPFHRIRLFASNPPRHCFSSLASMPVQRLVWAIRAAARHIPCASCLTQAISLQCLLAWAGHSADVQIGIAKNEFRGFISHAWVCYRGGILLGDSGDLGRYSPILVLKES